MPNKKTFKKLQKNGKKIKSDLDKKLFSKREKQHLVFKNIAKKKLWNYGLVF